MNGSGLPKMQVNSGDDRYWRRIGDEGD